MEVDETSGAVTLEANRPSGNFDLHTITVEFRAATNAVATTQTLTVRHQMVNPIISNPNGFQSHLSCSNPQVNSNTAGSLITVILPPAEEDTVYENPSGCNFFAFGRDDRVYVTDAPSPLTITNAVQTAGGLEVFVNRSNTPTEYAVRVDGTFPTFTDSDLTLSIVIRYTASGAAAHVVDDFLRTVYVVFPGVEKLKAVLEDSSGADAAITKPLTVYVGDTDTNAKLVASVNASGGEGSEYSYTGTRLGGDNTTLLVDSNNGEISVPAGFPAVVSPGTNFQLEVAVDDTDPNSDATRRGATTPAKVTLTLQYIKTSGPLTTTTEIATSPIADTAKTVFYHPKGESLAAALNVANIQPSGGIPPYIFEVQGEPADTDLMISGTENTRLVQLKSGATPSAETAEARRRMITVRVSDTGDTGNEINPTTMDVVVSVNFVEVTAHATLRIEDSGTNLLTPNLVVVRPASETGIVEVAELIKVDGEPETALTQTETDGLTFDESLFDLEIDANQNPPTGKTLSIVLTGSDGNGETQDSAAVKAQKAARQDRLYTISVRYVPEIKAEVLSTTDATLSNTDVVELTVAAGTQLVGKVAASGGVGGAYSYTPTPAQAGGTNLAVDDNGNINIIAGTIPVAGVGLSITVDIAVDDDSANTEGDRDETSAANVQIRVKYVLLEDLALTAKKLDGTDAGTGATDTVGTFYLLDGETTNAPMLVAMVTASGGIKLTGGAGDYTYALKGTGGDLTFDTSTRAVHIPNNITAATPGSAEATLAVTVEATDKRGEKTELIVRAVFETVQAHDNLVGTPAAGVEGTFLTEALTVRRVAADSNAIDVVDELNPANVATEDLSVEGAAGDLTYDTATKKLRIKENVAPSGNTLVVTLKVADKDSVGERENAARPDRLFMLSVVYAGMLEAAAINTEGNAPIAAAVNRFVALDEGAVNVATLSVSGGATPYTYAIEGELELHGANSATVRIPESAVPAAHPGTTLTARITVNDTNREDTLPLTLLLTVHYILGAGHAELTAKAVEGGAAIADVEAKTLAFVRAASSSSPLAVLSDVGFARSVTNEVLSKMSGELEFESDEIRIAANANPEGQILTLELKATDGEDSAEARARRDRLYTVRVRYVKELSAKALDATSSGTEIVATRQIRVSEAEATEAQFVAHIQVEGGAGNPSIKTGGDDFEIVGTELRIVATVVPGDLATGKLLTATVTVNDDESLVGGAETGEVEVLVTANYITLPPVAGSFVEGRDGNTAVPTSGPVTVYSPWTSTNAPATVAATAKAVVTGRSGDTFTFHKIGTEGKLAVNKDSGAVTLAPNRPGTQQNGNFDLHTITVEFRALTNAVASRLTLTVRHQMLRAISSAALGMTSNTACYDGEASQPGGQNISNSTGTQITVLLPTAEEGTAYSARSQCDHFVNARNSRTAPDTNKDTFQLVRTARDANGLELYDFETTTTTTTIANYRVRLAAGNTPRYTDDDLTLSIVIVNTHGGPGGHVVSEFLQTVYVVLPGVPKLEAVLQTPTGSAITKPLTVYTGATDSTTPAKVVATVKASGGEGDGYSYDGTALGGTPSLDLDASNGKISVPAGVVAVTTPGTNFQLEVTVNDTGGDAARRNATPPRKVTLTLQYIRTSGSLAVALDIETHAVADAANTTFYGAKGRELGSALNVATIRPSGGIPPYVFEVVGNTIAANLDISGADNTRVVQLRSGATPSAAGAAARRLITMRVSDTGDVDNGQAVQTTLISVTVNFVEVEPHGQLFVENADGDNLGTDFVVVTSGVSAQDVVLAPADSIYAERPTRRQDLGREAAVVSEVSNHGLRFNSNGLVITANTPLEGQTLSVVVQATDGAASQPTASAQAAARQDQTYTISVRYVPAIAAEVRSTTDAVLGTTDVVELTVVKGNHLVGKVVPSGGVGGAYSYALTPNTHLEVNATTGEIRIKADVDPVAGVGLSITVNIAVDDDSANTEGDRDETSAANVQIRVKYVLLEPLVLTAKNLQDANVGATDSVGTFYLVDGETLASALQVGSVEASGGIVPYKYELKGTGGDLTFNTDNRQVFIASQKSAATPDSAAATLLVTVQVSDSQTSAETKELTVRAVFESVQRHGALIVNSGGSNIGSNLVSVVSAADTNPRVISGDVKPTNGETGQTSIVQVSTFGLEYVGTNLQIAANAIPDGRTLSVLLMATDGGTATDRTDKAGARPDQLYTVQLRYIPALAAEARNAAGDAVLNAPIVITSKAGLTAVASISVSGGTSDTYDYSIAKIHDSANILIVSNDGVVSIPAEVIPIVGGLSLTVEITADDTGTNNDATDPASAQVTVIYHLLESPEIEAQDKDGTAALAAPVAVHQLSGVDLAANVPVAKVVGSKGTSPYTFAIVAPNTTGLEVDANTGNIVLKSGESTTQTGSAADRVITVRLTDSQTNRETADATITVRFEAVEPHADVVFNPVANNNGEHVVVRAGTQQAAVNVASFNTPSGDTLTKAGNAALVLNGGQVQIAAGTAPDAGQTLVAEITQSDTDDTTPQAIVRPDRTYTISVRYIPALAAEARNAAGTAPLADAVLEIAAETAASLNIASIAVSGGTSDDYDYFIENKHTGNALGVSNDGVVYIPAGVTPLQGDGLELTVAITVNDKAASKDNEATNPAVASITVKYVMDPGLGGQVQAVSDSTEVTSPTTIYRLAGDAAPAGGLATGLKVVGQRGEPGAEGYIYTIDGSNTSNLRLKANGEVMIAAGQTADESGEQAFTVKIADRRTPTPRETLVEVTVIFREVQPISTHPTHHFSSRQGCHEGARVHGATKAVIEMPAREKDFVFTSQGADGTPNACQFFGAFDDSREEFGMRGGSGGFDRTVVADETNGLRIDVRGNDTRIDLPQGGSFTYTDGETRLKIVIAYNDNGLGKDVTPELRKTVEIVFPGIPSVDAVLNDENGDAIPDIAAIEKRGPGNLSVFIGNLVASGGTGGLAIAKDATDGGELEIDNSGQVYIPDSVQPEAGAGNQLHLLVNVNDSGANSDRTAQKQLRIEVDYILKLGLGGQTQDLADAEVSGEHIVLRQAGNEVPTEGLTVAKVVGQRGEGAYTYEVEGDASGSKLVLHTASGSVAIAADETASGQLYLLTVQISDSASPAATALHTVSIRFNSVAPHGDLTRDLATGVTENSAGEFVIAQAGAPSSSFPVLTNIKSGDAALSRVGTDSFELLWAFNSSTGAGNVRIAGSPVTPIGQTLEIQLKASDGDGDAEKAARLDRTFDPILVRYLSHVNNAKLQNANDQDIDLSSPVEVRGPGSASVYVGDIAVSGGTGEFTFAKDGTGGLSLDETNGQVFIPSDAVPTSGGLQLAMTVNVNDKGKDNEVTNGTAIKITVNYVLEAVPLPLDGEVQQTDGTAVSGVHNVFQLEGYTVPPEGLDAGIKVVGSGGSRTYSYAVQGSADPGKLTVDETSGAISIQKDQTTGGFFATPRTLTVRITDSNSATKDVEVRVRLVGIEAHGALARTPASGVVETGGIYYVSQDGTQSGLVDVLNDIAGDGHPLNAVAGGSPELVFAPPVDAASTKGNLKIAANTEPTGQRLIITIRAHDGDDNAAELARPDRFYEITVVYLDHLEAQLWDAETNGATIDIATPINIIGTSRQSVFVGSVSVSGGTGAYEITKGNACNMDVDSAGNVFIPDSVTPLPDPGLSLLCQVIVSDKGDGSAATPELAAFEVAVRYMTTPHVRAEVWNADGSQKISAPINIRRRANQTGLAIVVATISASGGLPAGNQAYTYVGSAVGDSQTLLVNADGVVSIPAGVLPLSGGGRTMTLSIVVDDTNQSSTNEAQVQVVVVYVLSDPLLGEAQDLAGAALSEAPNFYRLAGIALTSATNALKIVGSGGALPYRYSIPAADSNVSGLSVDATTGIVAIDSGEIAGAGEAAGRTMTVRIIDGDGSTAEVTVTVNFAAVAAHGDLSIDDDQLDAPRNAEGHYVVGRAAEYRGAAQVIGSFNVDNADSLSMVSGAAELSLSYDSQTDSYQLEIVSGTAPGAASSGGLTLEATLRATDGEATPIRAARTDRDYEITVIYLDIDRGQRGNAVLADDPLLVGTATPPLYYRGEGGAAVVVATIQRISGDNWGKTGGELLIDSFGVVRIPASAAPTKDGLTLALRARLSGSRLPSRNIGFTVVYRTLPSAGWARAQSGAAVSERLTAWSDSQKVTLATLAAEGDYAADKVGGELALEQSGNAWLAAVPASASPGELLLTVRVRRSGGVPAQTVALTALLNPLASLRAEWRARPGVQTQRDAADETILLAANVAGHAASSASLTLFALSPSGGAAGGAADYAYSLVGAIANDKLGLSESGAVLLKPRETGSDSEVLALTAQVNDRGLGADLTPPVQLTLRVKYLPGALPPPPPLGLVWTNALTGVKTTIAAPGGGAQTVPTFTIGIVQSQVAQLSLIAGRFSATGGRGDLRVESARSGGALGGEFLADGRVRLEATCEAKSRVFGVRVSDSDVGIAPIDFRVALAVDCNTPFGELEAQVPPGDNVSGTGAADLSAVVKHQVPFIGETQPKRYTVLTNLRFKDPAERESGASLVIVSRDSAVYVGNRGSSANPRYEVGLLGVGSILSPSNEGGSTNTDTVDKDDKTIRSVVFRATGSGRIDRLYTIRIQLASDFRLRVVHDRTQPDSPQVEGIATTAYFRGTEVLFSPSTKEWDIAHIISTHGDGDHYTWIAGADKANLHIFSRQYQSGPQNRRVAVKPGQRPDADGILRVTVSAQRGTSPGTGPMAYVTVSARFVDARHSDLRAQLPNSAAADLSGEIAATVRATTRTAQSSPILAMQNIALNPTSGLQTNQRFTRIIKITGELDFTFSGGNLHIPANTVPGATLSVVLEADDGNTDAATPAESRLSPSQLTRFFANLNAADDLDNKARTTRQNRRYTLSVVYLAPPTREKAGGHLLDGNGIRLPQDGALTVHAVLPTLIPLAERAKVAEVAASAFISTSIEGDLQLDGTNIYIPAGRFPGNLGAAASLLTARVIFSDPTGVLEAATLSLRLRYLWTPEKVAATLTDGGGRAIVSEVVRHAATATTSPVVAASIAASGTGLTYRVLAGDLLVNAEGEIQISANVAPLASPGRQLTARIVVSPPPAQTRTAPATVDITVRYVLTELFGDLQLIAPTSPRVFGAAAGDSLNLAQRLTLVEGYREHFPSNLLTVAEAGIANAPPNTRIHAVGMVTLIGGRQTTLAASMAVRRAGDKNILIAYPARDNVGREVIATLRATDGDATPEARARPDRFYTVTAAQVMSLTGGALAADLQTQNRGLYYYAAPPFDGGRQYHSALRRVGLVSVNAPDGVELETALLATASPEATGRLDSWLANNRGYTVLLGGQPRDSIDVVWTEKTPGENPKILPFTLSVPMQNVRVDASPVWEEGGVLTPRAGSPTVIAITVDRYVGSNLRAVARGRVNTDGLHAINLPLYYRTPEGVVSSPKTMIDEAESCKAVAGGDSNIDLMTIPSANAPRGECVVFVNLLDRQDTTPDGSTYTSELEWVHRYPGLGLNPAATDEEPTKRRLRVDVILRTRPLTLTFAPAANTDRHFRRGSDPYRLVASRAGQLGTQTIFNINGSGGGNDDGLSINLIKAVGFAVDTTDAAARTWPVQISADVAVGQTLTLIAEINDKGKFAEHTEAVRSTLVAVYGAPTPIGASFIRSPQARRFVRGFGNPYRVSASRAGVLGSRTIFNLGASGGANQNALKVSIVTNDGFDMPTTDGRYWPVRISANIVPEGQTLTLIVELNDVGANSENTDATRVTLRAVYGTPPTPVIRGSFEEVRGDTAIDEGKGVTVYGLAETGVLTVAAKAVGTVSGDTARTFTYAKTGGGPLLVNSASGEISIPDSVQPENQNIEVTVQITSPGAIAATKAVTVHYAKVSPIVFSDAADNFQSQEQCHTEAVTYTESENLWRLVMPTRDSGFEFTNQPADGKTGNCVFLGAFNDDSESSGTRGGFGTSLSRAVVESDPKLTAAFVSDATNIDVNGSYTYTAQRATLKIVVSYNDSGAGAHVTPELRKTLEVVFPGR